MIERNSGKTWRTQAASWRYQTEGEGRQLQHQLIRCIFPSTHWHLQTRFCTQLVSFSCYLHFRIPPDRSGHSSLSCLSFKGRDSTPKFATGLTLAGRRMLQCQLWIPVFLGQLLVLLTSWEGPCLPCQGQAELTAPHPGCQHHSSCSAGITIAADTAAGSLCEESLAHLETAATSLLGLLLNHTAPNLFILLVIYSFPSSIWPFYKALPWSCSALTLTDLSDHLFSPFITCPPWKILL